MLTESAQLSAVEVLLGAVSPVLVVRSAAIQIRLGQGGFYLRFDQLSDRSP